MSYAINSYRDELSNAFLHAQGLQTWEEVNQCRTFMDSGMNYAEAVEAVKESRFGSYSPTLASATWRVEGDQTPVVQLDKMSPYELARLHKRIAEGAGSVTPARRATPPRKVATSEEANRKVILALQEQVNALAEKQPERHRRDMLKMTALFGVMFTVNAVADLLQTLTP